MRLASLSRSHSGIDPPASGAAPFCPAGSRASSSLPSTGSPRQARDKQDKLTLRRTDKVRLRSSPAVPRDGCSGARPSPLTPRLPRGRGGLPPKGFGTGTQSACGASTFLRSQEGPPSFPPRPRRQAGPRFILSMPRLCSFAKQTPLHRFRYGVPYITRVMDCST